MSKTIPPVVSAAADPKIADEIWRIRLSGIALMAVSAIGIALALYFYLTPLSPLPPNATEGYKNGRAVAQAFRNPLLIPINVFMLVAGFAMFRRQSYPVVVLGSIAALFPCNSLLCLNLPIAIWCLYLLNRPGTRKLFS